MSNQPENYLEQRFARFLTDRSHVPESQRGTFYDMVLRLSISQKDGHSCLQIHEEEQGVLERSHLARNALTDPTGDVQPLVVYEDNLYLERYYTYEARLAKQITDLAKKRFDTELNPDAATLLFPGESIENSDQARAAVTALNRALMIVSGGPGTGKTTTVVKMLALLLLHQEKPLRIGLAAPTGKAAMRLSESIGSSIEKLQLPQTVKELIPQNALTLHRLLGVKKHSPQFRHNSLHPLNYDVVVVDEASMVDLAMMSKLVDALKSGARLILLGDKDQLASVESGAVLSDLIYSLPQNSVELKITYRFDAGIKDLATSIKKVDYEGVWNQLAAGCDNVVRLAEDKLISYMAEQYGGYLRFVQSQFFLGDKDVREIFEHFNRFQVLCGVAYTEYGVSGINRKIEQRLAASGLQCKYGDWYIGRPILITRNDYGLDLYNGDIGICLWDDSTQKYRVWFERADGNLKSCSINLLPPHETVYAMTIHKSQGSEFGEVLVVLPKEDNRVLSRELIYTAVTRAKKSVKILGDSSVLKTAIKRQHERRSGLRQMLAAG